MVSPSNAFSAWTYSVTALRPRAGAIESFRLAEHEVIFDSHVPDQFQVVVRSLSRGVAPWVEEVNRLPDLASDARSTFAEPTQRAERRFWIHLPQLSE